MSRENESAYMLLYPILLEDPEKFFNYLRMSIASFTELLELIEDDITHKDTNLRKAISPTERLLITLR